MIENPDPFAVSKLAALATERLPIGDDDVHLWSVSFDDSLDADSEDLVRSLLTAEERDRELQFRFRRDRLGYILSRALVRNVVSAYSGIVPQDLALRTNSYGKPEIANDRPKSELVSFNVSHTEGLVALGVLRNGAIGIDVEKVNGRIAPLDLAERFFSRAELAGLSGCPSNERVRMFYRYWTLKESYVKARGLGLSMPLDDFGFGIDRASGCISFAPPPGDQAGAWQFWQSGFSDDHVLAVCAERAPGNRAALALRTFELASEGCALKVHPLGASA